MITTERTTMNGKPVLRVPVKTVLNLESGFGEKLLSDGPALALGEGCAYSCSFCYVPSVYQKQTRIEEALKAYNAAHKTALKHEDVVILREGAIETLRGQLLHGGTGKPKWKDPTDRRVVYASPADDVAANMELVKATVEACALILEHTCWQIRLLSKSNLLPVVAVRLMDHPRCERPSAGAKGYGFTPDDVRARMIFGFSTGTLDDKLAKAFEEGTPLVSKRIEALHVMQDNGFRTFGMVCPSLPVLGDNYSAWARDVADALRPDKLEHVWAEVINVRGDSFTRTFAALTAARFAEEAIAIARVAKDRHAWEFYNRRTFEAHAAVYDKWVGKLRFLTYVEPWTREWWQKKIAHGAVILGGHKTEKKEGSK
jgi:DNA repair photolyase